MAKAFKCDRCGTYYDPYSKVPEYTVADMTAPYSTTLDLCLPCIMALNDWMDLPKRIEGKSEVKRPVGRPKKATTDTLAEKAELAKKQAELDKTLDEIAKKRGEDEC